MHAKVIFWAVGGLLETRDVYIITKGKKSINAAKSKNVELTHTQVFCGRLCVLCARITVTKNKLYWCHGYLLEQNADCRQDTKWRLGTKCRRQIVDWVQNADWESKEFFRLVCDTISYYNLPSVTQTLFRGEMIAQKWHLVNCKMKFYNISEEKNTFNSQCAFWAHFSVCSVHFVLSMHFVPGLQSAFCSLHSTTEIGKLNETYL